MRAIHWLLTIAFMTASFDIFLMINVGGNLRLAQILMIVVMIAGIAKIFQSGTILWPAGGTALLSWLILQGLFLPLSSGGKYGTLLYIWLVFTVAGVYLTLQLYGRSRDLAPLMKAYLASYVFVCFFGIFQFVTPALHLGQYLVQQWIIHGLLPRINGFSYEPSFFVTYLMMGWIVMVDLRSSGAEILAGRTWGWLTILTGVTVFLSTSKTAWMFLILEGCARLAPVIYRTFVGALRRLRVGDIRIALPRWPVVIVLMLGMAGIGAGLYQASQVFDLNIFLAGTGLNNTASHSLDERSSEFESTLQVFSEQPFLGRSLGGVAGRRAEMKGGHLESQEDLALNWGFPVIIDVLAASGVFGVLPFLWFFTTISLGQIPLIRRSWSDERAKWLRALVRGMIFEFLLLLADQNVVRTYLWFHVTMVVVVGFNLRYINARESSAPGEQALAIPLEAV